MTTIDGMLGALDGDVEFEDFYRGEYGRVLALAYALTGDRGAAEDLVQDAFITAHRKWDRVSAYDAPGAFVRRVVVNRSRSRFRRRSRESSALARVVEPISVGEEYVDTDEFWRAVRSLPAQQVRCVALRYVEDLDVASIAEIIGCAESTVRVHLHRARTTLAARLRLEAE